MSSDKEFRWDNSHWAFTLVLSLLLLGFICYYAHVNYDSANGNQFLAVAATLSSIILAVVAILIAIAQMVMAGQQGGQFENRMGELRSAVQKMAPLPNSVDKLEELLEQVRLTHEAVGNLPVQLSDVVERRMTQEMNAAPGQLSDKDVKGSPDPGITVAMLLKNTLAFQSAMGVICAAHKKMLSRSELAGLFFEKFASVSEGSIVPEKYNFLVNSAVILLSNLGLMDPLDINEQRPVRVDDALRAAVRASLQRLVGSMNADSYVGIKKFLEMVVNEINVEVD